MLFWKHYGYKNLTTFVFALLAAVVLSQSESFHIFLLSLGALGYIGAFFAGMLFVSTFTVATGAVILLVLAERLSPIEIGIIAGLGAVIGDLIIFRFIKDNIVQELTRVYDHIDKKHHFIQVLHSKYFSWTLPVIGTLIIASPLPDELGVTLLGISKMKTFKFVLISFILNAIGIFLVVSASSFIRP